MNLLRSPTAMFIVTWLCISLSFIQASHIFKASSNKVRHKIQKLSVAPNLNDLHDVVIAIQPLNMDTLKRHLIRISTPSDSLYGQHMTRDEVNKLTINLEGINAVKSYLNEKGIIIVKESRFGDYITCRAPLHLWEKELKTKFHIYRSQESEELPARVVIRGEEYSLHTSIASHVLDVFNVVDLPVPVTSRVHVPGLVAISASGAERALSFPAEETYYLPVAFDDSLDPFGYTTPEFLATHYNVGDSYVSSGDTFQTQQAIRVAIYAAINESFSPSDLLQFQERFQLPQNSVSAPYGHSRDNACDGDSNSPLCGEGNLDVQYINAAAARNANTTFLFYDYNTSAYLSFIMSVADETNPPPVYSISYESYEEVIPEGQAIAFENEAVKLGAMGVTILASSGDDGAIGFIARGASSQCGYEPYFPSSCPYITSVGGTYGPQLGQPEVVCQVGQAQTDNTITSGGGFSRIFAQPSYQKAAVSGYFQLVDAGTITTPYQDPSLEMEEPTYYEGVYNLIPAGVFNSSNRGYPDISVLGWGYVVVDAGQYIVTGGTSASTPVIASFVVQMNAARAAAGMPLMGFLNPFIYENYQSFARDITSGDNKCTAAYAGNFTANPPYAIATCCLEGYYAGPGWDPTTGVGVPDFDLMLVAAMSTGSSSSSDGSALTSGEIFIIVGFAIIAVAVAISLIFRHFHLKPRLPLAAAQDKNNGNQML